MDARHRTTTMIDDLKRIVKDACLFCLDVVAGIVVTTAILGGLTCLLADDCGKPAIASALDCEAIKDADRRHYCRAIAIPRRSECEFIDDKNLRHECRARVK